MNIKATVTNILTTMLKRTVFINPVPSFLSAFETTNPPIITLEKLNPHPKISG
ncbi:MAG TPA: hypothetical protein PKC91_00555 [Ignavibacteria bacterium]|nr:hypothetical protein [Ignavibacteria bacterium]